MGAIYSSMERLPLPPLAVCSLLLSLVQMVLYLVFSLGNERYAALLPGHGFYIAAKPKVLLWTLPAFNKPSLGLFRENSSSVVSIRCAFPHTRVLTWAVGSSLESQAEVITVSVLYSRSPSICLLVRVSMRIVIE